MNALIVLSGGQDSTTVLFKVLTGNGYEEVHCVTFDYGQRHRAEVNAAIKVVAFARQYYPDIVLTHEIIELGPVLRGTSPLVSQERLEQYVGWEHLPGGIEKTFVPMRNMLFLTIAANRAAVHGCLHIYTGVSQEDYGGYPDCREAFIASLEDTMNASLDGVTKIYLRTPLMHLSKADTCIMASKIRGCFEALAFSHTSYDGAYPPTGNDHATLLRAKGFHEAHLPDPLVLRAVKEGLMELPTTANYDETRSEMDLEHRIQAQRQETLRD